MGLRTEGRQRQRQLHSWLANVIQKKKGYRRHISTLESQKVAKRAPIPSSLFTLCLKDLGPRGQRDPKA